jgi:high-affinity Fe2+/Pb2+ permease
MNLAEMYVVISILIGQHVVLMITWFVLRFIMRRNPLTAELLISELTR